MTAIPASESVSEAAVEAFLREGVVPLRGIFAPWVEGARQGIEQNMAAPTFRERSYRPDDGSAGFFQDFCNWSAIEGFRQLVEESPMAELAARLMASSTARIFHDHVLVKEPGTSVVTPWHHDQPYYPIEGRQSVSFWVALDPVARETAIEYVAGSHRWGRDYRPERFDGSNLYAGDETETVPDVDSRRDELDIRGWAMEPGDAVAFNFRTLHAAPSNKSATRRRVISLRWVGDDACFAKRNGSPSPPFPDLDIRDGEPFDAPEFPVVYRATAS